jgi:anti-anti-sigma factor
MRIFRSEKEFVENVIKSRNYEIKTTVKEKGEYKIISFQEGMAGLSDFQEVEAEVDSLLEMGNRFFAIDLSKYEYIYTQFVNVLVKIIKKVHEKQGKLCLFGLSNEMMLSFKIVGLHKLIDLFESEEQFLNSQK